MSCIKKISLGVLYTAVVYLSLHCATDSISGSGSKAGNPSVTARAYFADNTVAAEADVFIRPVDYVMDTTVSDSDRTPDATTDSNGCFVIDSVSPGTYLIEVNYRSTFAQMILYERAGNIDKEEKLDDIHLLQAGGFYGNVNKKCFMKKENVFVQIFGMERVALADSSGNFSFKGLPPGNHKLRISSSNPSYGVIDADTVAVNPGEYRNAGNFLLPFEYSKDSVIVREILDLNGLDTVPVDDVVVKRHGRVKELYLENCGITQLTPNIGKLRLHVLSISGNNLESLPDEIGEMYALKKLYCANNALAALPGTIGNLSHLYVINLNRNELQTLPVSITNLTCIRMLMVNNNRLKNLPESVKEWIDTYSYDPDWESTQRP